MPSTTPLKGRIFPLSQPESEAMKLFHQTSPSPSSARFFFVKKKDGGLRPCIDCRCLNDITIKFRYPLPLVPATLEQLCRAKYYTKLDLRNAYNLIRIWEGDEWKMAFSTTSGHYEYLVMPFGLANSPWVFRSFINDIFCDMLDRWVIVYIDNILIYSNNLEEHIRHVRSVLKRLMQYQLYAKAEKCEFHQTSTSFLSYVISQEGVAMDERKVKAFMEWPQPQTIKELQRFLGFANFYRRFTRDFSVIAAPLTTMTKRRAARLTWSPESRQAFYELKTRFTFRTHPLTPWSRTWAHCGDRCFKHGGRGNTVSTSWITSKDVSVCLFSPQTNSCWMELRRGQPQTSCHEISAWRMVSLAGGSYSPIPRSHRSYKSGVSTLS